MATILPAIHRQVLQWSVYVDATMEDQSNLYIPMIQQGLRQYSNMLIACPKNDPELHKTIDLLARYALRIREKESAISEYLGKIRQLQKDARDGVAFILRDRIEKIRLEGYQDSIVFPRNAQELQDLIEAKRVLQDLRSQIQFCCDVEDAQGKKLSQKQFQALIERSKSFDEKDAIEALQIAKMSLSIITAQIPEIPFHPEIVPSDQEKPSCTARLWSVICNGTSHLFSAVTKIKKVCANLIFR